MAEQSDIKTGTTTVGIIAKDAVVLAADMKATLGNIGYELEAQKIYRITDKIAVTNAGSVGDSLVIIRFLRAKAKVYETENGKPITAKAVATLLSNILNANRYFPYIAQFIIGGIEPKPTIFEVTPYGDMINRDKFATSGSGTPLAMAILDSEYKAGMTKEQAIEVAVHAIDASRKRDIYTGGRSIAVMVITSKGIEELPEKEVEKYLKKKQENSR
ncbi:MAG: proteasome subunit beta [Candidatus Diapherotrites archaeon]|nr:proteasome subunit beta [Candidatus Diapherotrites archaeon]